ncbi:DUF362 domain-containing protein [Candidatus Thorarchaeota archaeon]|nr:MAG: DUF362 domain-containing protein [Candidatus Thorarchaeota archaeon]
MDSVALVRYKQDIKSTLREGLELIGGFGKLRAPILIKPNICAEEDGTGHSLTDINVVKALVDLVFEIDEGLPIRIIESDSKDKYADITFEKFCYNQYCDEMKRSGADISTLNLSHTPLVTVPFEGRYFKNPVIPEIIVKPHYFISVAIAKTHYSAYITGALKNLFGILPKKEKEIYHPRIHDVISDLAMIIRPELNIIDARVGVEGWDGPTTHKIGAFILGRQPVSVDAVMTLMMGLNPNDVSHLVQSKNQNLGDFNPTVVGESIESAKIQFNVPKIIVYDNA